MKTHGPSEEEPTASPRGPVVASSLERIAQGDRSAVGDCLDRHGALVWSLVRRHCENPADAEDLVQDVFIALWKNASRFDPRRSSETTFVAMITRRRLIDRGRKIRARPEPGPLPDGLTASPLASTIESDDEIRRANVALAQLRDEQRNVLSLSLRDGLTHDEIARTTGIPLGTVKTHARRGLIRLRELLRGGEGRGA